MATHAKFICFLEGAECLRTLVEQCCFLLIRHRDECEGTENERVTEFERDALY